MAEYTIDKIEYGDNVYNLSPNVVYATCPTAAGTAAKVATITSGTLTSLNAGDQVIVKFTYANGKASPTLKVGSTDAKSIMRYGTTAPSTSAATSWNAGSCVWFVYDGTYWQMAGWINSTYTVTDKKLEIGAVTSGTTYYPIVGTNSTAAATRQYDSTGFEYSVFTGTTETQGGAGIRLGNSTATGTDGNKKGFITIYGTGSNSSTLYGPSGGTSSYNVWLPEKGGIIALTTDIPDVSSFITDAGVTKITTTAGAHTAITNATGAVSFKVPTTAAHVGAAASDHTHGNITNGGDITATAPTIASGDQIIINDHSASKITNGPTFDGSTTTTALTPKGTWETFSKFSGSYNDLTNKPTIPTLPSNIVNTITTTEGAHTTITNSTGTVSFKVPTKTSHLTNDSGFITSYADEKIKLTSQSTSGTYPLIFGPTSITSNSTYQGYYNTGITVNPSTKTVTATTFVGALTGTASGNLTSSSTLDATKLSGTIPAGCYTNTTYGISGSLSNHAFTSTLTAGGSGTASVLTLAAGTGITLTDDTTNKKITIACSVTNTDTKLQVAEVTSGTTYYPLVGTGTTAATRQYDTTGCSYTGTNGTANNYSNGKAILALGNNVPFTSNNWKRGVLRLYGNKEYYTDLISDASYNNREVLIPNKSGTIALLDDLPPIQYIIIYEDTDSPGTYNADLSALDLAQIGDLIYVSLNLLNANDEYDSYILTDYYMEYATEDNEIYYQVLWFTNEFRRVGDFIKRITCGIYLDETETTHAYGEVTVNVREIGERYTVNGGDEGYTTNISTTADQFKQLAVLNLPAGKWIITARARFTPTSSSNHYSAINIGTATAGSGSTTTGNSIRDRRYGEGTYFNQHALTRILHLTTDTPVYLNGGGSNVSGTWNRTNEVFQFDAIRIS